MRIVRIAFANTSEWSVRSLLCNATLAAGIGCTFPAYWSEAYGAAKVGDPLVSIFNFGAASFAVVSQTRTNQTMLQIKSNIPPQNALLEIDINEPLSNLVNQNYTVKVAPGRLQGFALGHAGDL